MRATGKKIWDSNNQYYIYFKRNTDNKYFIYNHHNENLGEYIFQHVHNNIWRMTSGTVRFILPNYKGKLKLPDWF